MNENDKELLKTTPSMFKGIAVQVDQVNSGHNLSLSAKDVCGMAEFGLALCGQISEADNTNTGKVIAECAIGNALIGSFIGLLAANLANKSAQKKRITYQLQPVNPPHTRQQRPGNQNGRVGTIVSPAVKNFSPKHLRNNN